MRRREYLMHLVIVLVAMLAIGVIAIAVADDGEQSRRVEDYIEALR